MSHYFNDPTLNFLNGYMKLYGILFHLLCSLHFFVFGLENISNVNNREKKERKRKRGRRAGGKKGMLGRREGVKKRGRVWGMWEEGRKGKGKGRWREREKKRNEKKERKRKKQWRERRKQKGEEEKRIICQHLEYRNIIEKFKLLSYLDNIETAGHSKVNKWKKQRSCQLILGTGQHFSWLHRSC